MNPNSMPPNPNQPQPAPNPPSPNMALPQTPPNPNMGPPPASPNPNMGHLQLRLTPTWGRHQAPSHPGVGLPQSHLPPSNPSGSPNKKVLLIVGLAVVGLLIVVGVIVAMTLGGDDTSKSEVAPDASATDDQNQANDYEDAGSDVSGTNEAEEDEPYAAVGDPNGTDGSTDSAALITDIDSLDQAQAHLESLKFKCKQSTLSEEMDSLPSINVSESLLDAFKKSVGDVKVVTCADETYGYGFEEISVMTEEDMDRALTGSIEVAIQEYCPQILKMNPQELKALETQIKPLLEGGFKDAYKGAVSVNGYIYSAQSWDIEDLKGMLDESGVSYESVNPPELSLSVGSVCS